jgi:hypothetical protein
MLEPQQIIDSLQSISRNVMLTEEQRLAASAAAHSLAEIPDETQPPTNQWRPIAEAEGSEERLMVGGYLYGDWTRTFGPYKEAVRYGYTHYLPIPEPPARDGE